MIAYVVKEWKVAEDLEQDGKLVKISGRAPGLIAWALSVLKIDPTVSVEIDKNSFEFAEGSFSGIIRRTIPINKISSVFYGYTRPWKQAIAIFFASAFIFNILIAGVIRNPGILSMLATLVIGIAASVYYYLLNKTLTLGVVEVGGGICSGIEIKRSVIEGLRLDESHAEQVCSILYTLINEKN